MSSCSFDFHQSVFTYAIATRSIDGYDKKQSFYDGKVIINYTEKTQVLSALSGNREVAVIGFCVDALGEISTESIANYLADIDTNNVEAIFHQIRRFAGKFIVVYRNSSSVYVFTDAYGLLQVNYAKKDNDFCIASIDKTVGDYFSLPVSPKAIKIRNGGDYSQPLPNDITMYDEVKILLPNHYLDISTFSCKRVCLQVEKVKTKEEKTHVIEKSIKLIENIQKEYEKHFQIACPLTAGRDSRVVFAFLNRTKKELPCYTFWHKNFTENTADLAVPRTIMQEKARKYYVIKDMVPDDSYKEAVQRCIGQYHSMYTVELAYTFAQSFPEHILIHSDILDQIGKSSLGKNIPAFLANASYLSCKMHNFSGKINSYMKEYCRKIKDSGEKQNIFDLFCIEQDGAKWVAQGQMIYAVCGVTTLNLFNCGILLDMWLSLPRKDRKNFILHNAFLNGLDPILMQYPFNPGEKYGKIKKSSLFMWIGTYVRYWILWLMGRKKA